MSSASTETPDIAAQYIYVDNDHLLRFCAWFMLKHYWFDVQWWEPVGLFRVRFAINVDLREELPAFLRGKFSTKP